MRRHAMQIAAALILGFGLGVFVGQWHAGQQREGRRSPGERLERFSRRLDLTAEQREKVGKLLEASREQLMSLQSEVQPRFREVRGETAAEIRALLTEEQAEEFDRMEAEASELRKRMRPRRPRPPR